MPFITQGKTNWKFVLIIVILAVIIGAGALWYAKIQEEPYQSVENTNNKGVQNLSLTAQATYNCNGGKTIQAAFYKGEPKPVEPGQPPIPTGSVKLILSDGRRFDLPQTISADGGRYANSDESFVFWSKGDGALVLENGVAKDYQGCLVASTEEKSAQEQSCIDSGGTVSTSLCCKSSTDFPNSCLIGACGCSPDNSYQVKVCDCGVDGCFDGEKCVLKEVTKDETANWKTYESKDLGLTFKFPNISGETQYFYNEFPKRDYDPTGTIYGWKIKRTDINWTYTFVGGSSIDAMVGRSGWVTDNYRWLIENNKYYIERMGGGKIEVQIEKVSKPNSGVKGIILTSEKNPNLFAGEGEEENEVIKGKLAIVNFPSSYSKKPQIKSISFYFYDSMTTNQIEKVIKLVTFSN